jgi:phage tail sheath protein FI
MSKYLWAKDKPNTATDNWFSPAQGVAFDSLSVTDDLTDVATGLPLTGGAEGDIPTEGEIQIGWDLYNNADQYDISMLLAGAATPATAKYVVQIAESRRDCLAFVSAATATGEPILDAVVATAIANTVAFRTDAAFNVNSSFCVMDSGWKYQYDRYCDLYRWVPLNADIAGLCARTDYTNDPWWSPGGLNRGQIKNVIKLNVSPNQSQRDTLYQSGVNPVVSFAGMGTVLYGDKTLLTKPSAFDRINVRRLFIVLEKAIAIAAKYQLFEFNDAFTRAQFKSMVDPFLRDVQGRRGIYDFRVVCNENNNTGEVIDRNEFIADIFIKPARSINFLTLNFIASRTSVSFEEIGG